MKRLNPIYISRYDVGNTVTRRTDGRELVRTVRWMILLITAGWILLTPVLASGNVESAPTSGNIMETPPENPRINPIFQSGEELVYQVSWMGIKAGTITMILNEDGFFMGRQVYKGTIIGRTSKKFSRFFEVEDVIESTFSRESFNSIYFIKSIREGKYRKVKETIYDQSKKEAWHPDKLDTKYALRPDSKDPVACIFNLRRNLLAPGMVVKMNANSDGKHCYPIEVHIAEKETVKLPAGNYTALVGKPLPTWEGRMFEKNKSRLTVWLSDDEFLVPLKIKVKVKIGSLKALLISRKGPGWEIDGETDI